MPDVSQFNTIYIEEVYSIPVPLTVVVNIPWAELPPDQQQLLSKILAAVGNSLESVRIVYNPEFDLSSWKEKPSKILALVRPPKGILAYELLTVGEISMVFSEPLETLISDEGSKRKLWNILRALFPS